MFHKLIENPDLITGIVTIGTLVFAIFMYINNNNRQKNQSTIEYYNKISNEACAPLRDMIGLLLNETFSNYSHKAIMRNDSIWVDNQDFQYKCFKYCRYMERFAVGIKLNIYDYKTFFNIAGITTVKLFHQIQDLIKENKYSDYYDNVFCPEYKNLCKKLTKSLKRGN